MMRAMFLGYPHIVTLCFTMFHSTKCPTQFCRFTPFTGCFSHGFHPFLFPCLNSSLVVVVILCRSAGPGGEAAGSSSYVSQLCADLQILRVNVLAPRTSADNLPSKTPMDIHEPSVAIMFSCDSSFPLV